MASFANPLEGCHHDRAPLNRLGKVRHERTGKSVYVLLCTECGFTVTTEQLRRLKGSHYEVSRQRRVVAWAPAAQRPVW